MQDNNYPEPSSSSHVGSSSNGGGRTTARTRAHRSWSPLITQHGGWSSHHDLLDQLTSSVFGSSCYLPHTMAEPTPSSEMESSSQNNEESSSSLSAINSSLSSEATNHPVSSPSLRKILHPTNTEIIQKSHTSSEKNVLGSTSTKPPLVSPPEPETEYLAEYTCPICFLPPTNATLTPCGHICCGSCLFTAVKTVARRGNFMGAESTAARCPVCRADIPGWDGKGGGVIGLRPRAVISL